MTLHITWGPDKLVREEPDGERWCFGCRKRLTHTWQLWADSKPSYYDPVWLLKCSGCGQDRTRFPGR